MTRWLHRIVNVFFHSRTRRRCSVAVDSSAKVNWYALRSMKGGSLSIGAQSIVNCRVDFDSPGGRVRVGDRCYIGASHLVCHTGITFGNDVIVSWGVTIVDHDSHSLIWSERANDVLDWAHGRKDWSKIAVRPVVLCDKVWVGFGASILKGVTVGEGSVIAANSTVTKDVPPYTLVAGSPARVIRTLCPAGGLVP